MTGDILDRAKPFLVECPICDYGIGSPCVCPDGDYRPVMADLIAEVRRLRAETAVAYGRGRDDEAAGLPIPEDPMTYAHAEPDEPTFAYLVIYDPGGLGGAHLDEDRAHEQALHTQSVVVKVPVVGDYRTEKETL